jgi:hypothetical protein
MVGGFDLGRRGKAVASGGLCSATVLLLVWRMTMTVGDGLGPVGLCQRREREGELGCRPKTRRSSLFFVKPFFDFVCKLFLQF